MTDPKETTGRLGRVNRYPDHIIQDNVYIPEESFGWCVGKNCSVYDLLADGFCVKCWDHKSYSSIRIRSKQEKLRGKPVAEELRDNIDKTEEG